jgi:hypothetical protein
MVDIEISRLGALRKIAPPALLEFSVKVELAIETVPPLALTARPPPKAAAELPEMVESITLTVFVVAGSSATAMPPPGPMVELPEMVEFEITT